MFPWKQQGRKQGKSFQLMWICKHLTFSLHCYPKQTLEFKQEPHEILPAKELKQMPLEKAQSYIERKPNSFTHFHKCTRVWMSHSQFLLCFTSCNIHNLVLRKQGLMHVGKVLSQIRDNIFSLYWILLRIVILLSKNTIKAKSVIPDKAVQTQILKSLFY